MMRQFMYKYTRKFIIFNVFESMEMYRSSLHLTTNISSRPIEIDIQRGELFFKGLRWQYRSKWVCKRKLAYFKCFRAIIKWERGCRKEFRCMCMRYLNSSCILVSYFIDAELLFCIINTMLTDVTPSKEHSHKSERCGKEAYSKKIIYHRVY